MLRRSTVSKKALLSAVFAIYLLTANASCNEGDSAQVDAKALSVHGPGTVAVDDFRDAGTASAKPVRGGQLTVHVTTRPLHLNRMIQSGADLRRILEDVHARLVERDWETWELVPSLAGSVEVTDSLILKPKPGSEEGSVLIGDVAERSSEQAEWIITPNSGTGESAPVRREFVDRVERQTVFTFHLREDVKWHDGHGFNAQDVIFSLDCYLNPLVQSEHSRHSFQELRSYKALDEFTVQVVFNESAVHSLSLFEDQFVILPRHIYDLSDAENPAFESGAPEELKAEFINENSANSNWVGLGPYRVTAFTDQSIDAVRFDDYFDAEQAGYVDSVRWRIITDDNATKRALLEGELDFMARLRSREYLGDFCSQSDFADHFDKGLYYTPQFNYIAWNQRRPLFKDVRVRRALAHCFDWDEFIATIGSGMGQAVSASWYCFSDDYDQSLNRYPFDLDRAEELLFEAGWIDRNGDGTIDREGREFEFEYLFSKADATMRLVGQKLKENLERIGIKMTLVGRDFASRQALLGTRDFDASAGSWIFGPEAEPYRLWHSSQADLERSANLAGYSDEVSDGLMEAIQTEFDVKTRRHLLFKLQARIYAAQPYMFGCLFPNKFAVSKRVRGVQRFALDPGYSIRRWWIDPNLDKR